MYPWGRIQGMFFIDKSKKFEIKNQDVLHTLEQIHLLENLELLQVWQSNKSVEIRFDSGQATQEFPTCDITIWGSKVVFRCNAFRRLRVSIHGVHPNVSDAALEYEMQNHFGGVIDVRKDTSSYKEKNTKRDREPSWSQNYMTI